MDAKKTGKERAGKSGLPGEQVQSEIEALKIKLNRCFVETILPAVFATEKELHEAGFWNRLRIEHSATLSSGKPAIREVRFLFHPERAIDASNHHQLSAAAHRAEFKPAGDLRHIVFSIHFPNTVLPVPETVAAVHRIEAVDTPLVDAFLEKFVKEAVAVYASNRIFR
jgi:hypothetical protein